MMDGPVDPLDLFDESRLDLVVKHRFFRHLMEGGDPDSERLYRWHIDKRTGGIEPGSWKACLDDYVKGCVDLLASMRARGFDPQHPIRFGDNGALMAGAHRIACAHALRIPVSVKRVDRPGKSARWDRDAFVMQGVAVPDLQRILDDWKTLKHERRKNRHRDDARDQRASV